MEIVWLFFGYNASMPSGVFSSLEKAGEWIAANRLSGTLIQFPFDEGTYDHAVRYGLFRPRQGNEISAAFKATFVPNLVQEYYYNGQPARLTRMVNVIQPFNPAAPP